MLFFVRISAELRRAGVSHIIVIAVFEGARVAGRPLILGIKGRIKHCFPFGPCFSAVGRTDVFDTVVSVSYAVRDERRSRRPYIYAVAVYQDSRSVAICVLGAPRRGENYLPRIGTYDFEG